MWEMLGADMQYATGPDALVRFILVSKKAPVISKGAQTVL